MENLSQSGEDASPGLRSCRLGLHCLDLSCHADGQWNGEHQRQHIGCGLNTGQAVGTPELSHRKNNWQEAGPLPGGGQQKRAPGLAQADTEHIDHHDPAVNGQSQALQPQTQSGDPQHIRILSGKNADNGRGRKNRIVPRNRLPRMATQAEKR